MTTDNKDSNHRKHRRSSSDEDANKSSKRHKHRHHHRHHSHRHRSKKHEEESKAVDDISSPRSPPPATMPIANSAPQPDDDVEEGEILDDNSDGDNKHVEFRPILEDHRDSHPLEDAVGKISEENSMENQNNASDQDGMVPDDDGFYDASKKHDSESAGDHKGSRFPLKCWSRGSDIEVEDLEAYNKKPGDMRKFSSESSGESYRRSCHSTLDERYSDHSRDKLRHHDVAIESYSKSTGDEEVHRKRHRTELDRSQGRRHGSRVKDDERERSASYSRYDGEVRYSNLDTRGRDSREKDVYKDQRNADREKSKDYEMERRRGVEASKRADREADNERRKDKERNRSRDRDMEKHQIKEHRATKYEDVDSYRKSERARSRSRDREVDLDRRRGKEADKIRDRVGVGDHDRERRKYRDGEREWDRGAERQTGRSKDRSRYSEIDRDQDSYSRFKSLKEGGAETRPDRTKRSHTEYMEAGSKQRREVGEDDEDIEEGISLKPVEQEEDEVNRIIEESRKRKQAILEKYKNHQTVQKNEVPSEVKKGRPAVPVESCGQAVAAYLAPDSGAVTDDLDTYVADPSLAVGKSLVGNGNIAPDTTSEAAGLGEGSPKSERSGGIFCDDIFGETPTGVRKMGKGDAFPVIRSALNDNWDDAEGYYSYRFGELLDGRYEITAAHGKGVFSTVVRAKDLKAGNGDPDEVAIKIIRNNETMHKAGQLEVQILKKLAGADPENKRHCVRFLSSFKYRNHLCLVFESLHMNLREVLKKFGRNIGLSLTAVRAYAKQLFIALKHLKNCGVLHCDIKPDNMLVNEAKNVLKLCDFGNAMFAGKNEITPYLVSRFYRAPEIILGLTYDHPMDIWSVGCCLYELYTGKVLFPGPSNNDMLRLHMELKGPFPKKMLRKGAFTDQHFDQDLNFYAIEEDLVTKKTLKRMILNIKQKDIGSIVKSSSSTVEEGKMLVNFKDLLDKIFVLDPEKRITVAQALAHPFITGK